MLDQVLVESYVQIDANLLLYNNTICNLIISNVSVFYELNMEKQK